MKIIHLAIFFTSIYSVKSDTLKVDPSKTNLKEGDNLTITTIVKLSLKEKITVVNWFYNQNEDPIASSSSKTNIAIINDGKALFGDRIFASVSSISDIVYVLNFNNLRANDSMALTVILTYQNTDLPIQQSFFVLNQTLTIDVIADPVILSFPEVLFVKEGNRLFVESTIYGRPPPTTNIVYADQKYNADSNNDLSNNAYKYAYNLSSFYANNCGSLLLLNVYGNGIAITRNATVYVLFTPELIMLSSPVEQSENFLINLKWYSVPSGACGPITYNIEFLNSTNQIVEQFYGINTTSFSTFNNANATNFKIYAVYNGTRGFQLNQPIPPPQPITTIATTTAKTTITTSKPATSAQQSNKGLSVGLVVGVAVGAVVFVLIIGVIIVVVFKKKTSSSSKNQNINIGGASKPIKPDVFPLKDKRKGSDENDYPPSKKSQDPDQMIYAQLGAGGGRTGPKPNPNNSNYAEIKVDDMGYPARGPTSDKLPSNPPPYDDILQRYSRPPSETFDDGIIV